MHRCLGRRLKINAEMLPLTMVPGVHTLRVQSVVRMVTAAWDGFGGGSGDLLDRKPALGAITDKNFNLGGPINPPTQGTVAGYFCHTVGRGDTERANSRQTALRDRGIK